MHQKERRAISGEVLGQVDGGQVKLRTHFAQGDMDGQRAGAGGVIELHGLGLVNRLGKPPTAAVTTL